MIGIFVITILPAEPRNLTNVDKRPNEILALKMMT